MVHQTPPSGADLDRFPWNRPNLLRKRGILAPPSSFDAGEWRLVFESTAPFHAVPDVLAGDESVRLVGGALEVHSPPSHRWVALRGVTGAGTEVRATFGYPKWTHSVRLGFVLCVGNTQQPSYQFVVGRFGMDVARTFEEARDKDEFVAARIVRNGVVVREHRWRASALPAGPLEMTVTRLADDLALQVACLQPCLELIDLMPLVRSSDPAELALDWPEGVALTGLRVRDRPVSHGRSPLERGDGLYNANAFRDAAEFYGKHASGDVAVASEAGYKKALCLTHTRRPKVREAAALFASVARECSGAPIGDPRRKWCVPAAFQAWRIVHAKDIEIPGADALEAILTSGPRDDPDDDVLLPSLTQSELDDFIKYFAPYAFSTSPYHLLKHEHQRIGLLEQAIRTMDRLDPTGASSVGPPTRIAPRPSFGAKLRPGRTVGRRTASDAARPGLEADDYSRRRLARDRAGTAGRHPPRHRPSRPPDSAEDVPFLSDGHELRRGLMATGNQPASRVCVNLCNKTIYNIKIGGGGNCTRVPSSINDGLCVRRR